MLNNKGTKKEQEAQLLAIEAQTKTLRKRLDTAKSLVGEIEKVLADAKKASLVLLLLGVLVAGKAQAQASEGEMLLEAMPNYGWFTGISKAELAELDSLSQVPITGFCVAKVKASDTWTSFAKEFSRSEGYWKLLQLQVGNRLFDAKAEVRELEAGDLLAIPYHCLPE